MGYCLGDFDNGLGVYVAPTPTGSVLRYRTITNHGAPTSVSPPYQTGKPDHVKNWEARLYVAANRVKSLSRDLRVRIAVINNKLDLLYEKLWRGYNEMISDEEEQSLIAQAEKDKNEVEQLLLERRKIDTNADYTSEEKRVVKKYEYLTTPFDLEEITRLYNESQPKLKELLEIRNGYVDSTGALRHRLKETNTSYMTLQALFEGKVDWLRSNAWRLWLDRNPLATVEEKNAKRAEIYNDGRESEAEALRINFHTDIALYEMYEYWFDTFLNINQLSEEEAINRLKSLYTINSLEFKQTKVEFEAEKIQRKAEINKWRKEAADIMLQYSNLIHAWDKGAIDMAFHNGKYKLPSAQAFDLWADGVTHYPKDIKEYLGIDTVSSLPLYRKIVRGNEKVLRGQCVYVPLAARTICQDYNTYSLAYGYSVYPNKVVPVKNWSTGAIENVVMDEDETLKNHLIHVLRRYVEREKELAKKAGREFIVNDFLKVPLETYPEADIPQAVWDKIYAAKERYKQEVIQNTRNLVSKMSDLEVKEFRKRINDFGLFVNFDGCAECKTPTGYKFPKLDIGDLVLTFKTDLEIERALEAEKAKLASEYHAKAEFAYTNPQQFFANVQIKDNDPFLNNPHYVQAVLTKEWLANRKLDLSGKRITHYKTVYTEGEPITIRRGRVKYRTRAVGTTTVVPVYLPPNEQSQATKQTLRKLKDIKETVFLDYFLKETPNNLTLTQKEYMESYLALRPDVYEGVPIPDTVKPLLSTKQPEDILFEEQERRLTNTKKLFEEYTEYYKAYLLKANEEMVEKTKQTSEELIKKATEARDLLLETREKLIRERQEAADKGLFDFENDRIITQPTIEPETTSDAMGWGFNPIKAVLSVASGAFNLVSKGIQAGLDAAKDAAVAAANLTAKTLTAAAKATEQSVVSAGAVTSQLKGLKSAGKLVSVATSTAMDGLKPVQSIVGEAATKSFDVVKIIENTTVTQIKALEDESINIVSKALPQPVKTFVTKTAEATMDVVNVGVGVTTLATSKALDVAAPVLNPVLEPALTVTKPLTNVVLDVAKPIAEVTHTEFLLDVAAPVTTMLTTGKTPQQIQEEQKAQQLAQQQEMAAYEKQLQEKTAMELAQAESEAKLQLEAAEKERLSLIEKAKTDRDAKIALARAQAAKILAEAKLKATQNEKNVRQGVIPSQTTKKSKVPLILGGIAAAAALYLNS